MESDKEIERLYNSDIFITNSFYRFPQLATFDNGKSFLK